MSRLIEGPLPGPARYSLLQPGTPTNRRLRAGLALAATSSTLATFATMLPTYPLAVDFQIPMQAVERWVHGGSPYLASSFEITSGAGQPFLYPPFLLPLLAPFSDLPGVPVTLAWAAVCLAAAAWTCRRLGIPAWIWPLTLAWPPFAEALLGLNVQVLLVAAFVALCFADTAPGAVPVDRDLAPSATARPAILDGSLGMVVAILKTSQVHPWVYLLRRRQRAAIAGVAVAVALVLTTLPFTGFGLWLDWLAQVRRAAQPGLAVGGISLEHYVPLPLGAAFSLASVALVFLVPRRHAGAWIGVLTILGSPDLHVFGLLFLVPAMLSVRREIGLTAACSIGFFTALGSWLGVLLVAGALLLSTRWPSLLEPDPYRPGHAA